MTDRGKTASPLLLLALALLLGACSSQLAQEEDYGGFLTNYDQMTEMESTDGVKILGWRKPGLDLSQYHAVKVDPVAMSPNADIGKRIGAEELEQIRESLHIKMVVAGVRDRKCADHNRVVLGVVQGDMVGGISHPTLQLRFYGHDFGT